MKQPHPHPHPPQVCAGQGAGAQPGGREAHLYPLRQRGPPLGPGRLHDLLRPRQGPPPGPAVAQQAQPKDPGAAHTDAAGALLRAVQRDEEAARGPAVPRPGQGQGRQGAGQGLAPRGEAEQPERIGQAALRPRRRRVRQGGDCIHPAGARCRRSAADHPRARRRRARGGDDRQRPPPRTVRAGQRFRARAHGGGGGSRGGERGAVYLHQPGQPEPPNHRPRELRRRRQVHRLELPGQRAVDRVDTVHDAAEGAARRPSVDAAGRDLQLAGPGGRQHRGRSGRPLYAGRHGGDAAKVRHLVGGWEQRVL